MKKSNVTINENVRKMTCVNIYIGTYSHLRVTIPLVQGHPTEPGPAPSDSILYRLLYAKHVHEDIHDYPQNCG